MVTALQTPWSTELTSVQKSVYPRFGEAGGSVCIGLVGTKPREGLWAGGDTAVRRDVDHVAIHLTPHMLVCLHNIYLIIVIKCPRQVQFYH